MIEKSKIEINAIQDVDLEKALQNSSKYQDLIEGKIYCKSCGTIITEKNVSVNIYAIKIPVQYVDKNASISLGFINIKIW